ncbi:MAG: SPOR domain-containing protein, partial [Bacteroidaceae bacterium]|nr:SPOR domain-containing protein [Bacteroidaceae bacterium]
KKEAIITQTSRTIDLHIQKRALRQIVSTAAVFLLLLMAALPVGDLKPTDIASLQIANIANESAKCIATDIEVIAIEETHDEQVSIEAIELETTIENTVGPITETTGESDFEETVAEVTSEIIAEAPAQTTIETPITITEPETLQTETNTKTYHIIVASLPSKRGADEVIEGYVAKGYQQASLIERDNRVRISLAQFTDKDEANNYLKTLREDEVFQNAWLLPVNN